MPNNTAFYGQIEPQQVDKIGAQGFKTIINNRPDGEEPNQPLQTDIATEAQQAGLAYHYLPVVGGQLTREQVEQFAEIFNQAEKPVFMFCRSGNRSNVLFQSAKQLDLLDD
ncbi:TIGR01244 family sulfur transferase [Moraxella osloensis]|nr:TIGR01244 family sulfur transferase [Moraxella osloensis]MDK1669598.1 TIGR01244 family sulfur transferase [Moraxella osloensis]